jgi:hypothetical protein
VFPKLGKGARNRQRAVWLLRGFTLTERIYTHVNISDKSELKSHQTARKAGSLPCLRKRLLSAWNMYLTTPSHQGYLPQVCLWMVGEVGGEHVNLKDT